MILAFLSNMIFFDDDTDVCLETSWALQGVEGIYEVPLSHLPVPMCVGHAH